MKIPIIFLILLFVGSCLPLKNKKKSIAEFDMKISGEWIYTQKINNFKYSGQELIRPPGLEQLVMGLTLMEEGGLRYKMHCVYYRVAYKNKLSNFKVQELVGKDSCPEAAEEGENFLSIDEINNLKITFSNFQLILEFNYMNIKNKIEIPMPNIEDGLIHKKFQGLKENKLMSSLMFLRLSEKTFDLFNNKSLGQLSNRFSNGTVIRCQHIGSDCKTIGENLCDECRYGWYEVIDFQCPGGGSKFCGQNHCGEKNEPACLRGAVKNNSDEEEKGICQSDLSPVLNNDKILVCQ